MRNTFIILILCFPFEIMAQVEFSDSTFVHILHEAQAEGKDVMVNMYVERCSFCSEMDSVVFNDTTFGNFINERFLCLNLNAEEGFGIDMAMKYRVSRFPEILFFDSDGHLKYRWEGNIEAPTLQWYILNSDSVWPKLAPLPYPLDFALDYPAFYRDTYKKRPERTYPTDAQVSQFMLSRDSITDEVSWGVLSKLVTDYSWVDSVYMYRDILSRRYGEQEVNDKLQNSVYDRVKNAIKDNSETELYEALRKANIYLGKSAPPIKMRYQLYYYQMKGRWSTYAALGSEIARDSSLYDSEWLTQIAQTIHRNTKEPKAISTALTWMKPIAQADSTYATLGAEAWLYYYLDQIPPAENAANAAIIAASETEDIDTSEVQSLLKLINLSR